MRGRDVQHRDEQAHEHGAGADIALEDEQQQAGRPGHQDRAEMARPGQPDAEYPPADQGQRLALGYQVAGERDGQRQLGELLGLDGERAEPDLNLGAGVSHLADRRGQQGGQRDQHDSDGAQRVGVALQHPGLADESEQSDEAADADGRVEDLDVRRGLGQRGRQQVPLSREPVRHHDSEAVQDGREREQQRVRVRREPAQRQVGDDHDDDEHAHVFGQTRGQPALEAVTHVGERERDQAEGEHEHDQLRTAAAASGRRQRAGWIDRR